MQDIKTSNFLVKVPADHLITEDITVMISDLEDARRVTANEYPHGGTDAKMGYHQARRNMLVDLDGSSDEHWDAEDLHEKRLFLHTEREPVSREYNTTIGPSEV